MTSNELRLSIEESIKDGSLNFDDTVKLFEHLGKDVLRIKTRAAYGRAKGKCYNAHQFAKGPRIVFSGIEFITDCE